MVSTKVSPPILALPRKKYIINNTHRHRHFFRQTYKPHYYIKTTTIYAYYFATVFWTIIWFKIIIIICTPSMIFSNSNPLYYYIFDRIQIYRSAYDIVNFIFDSMRIIYNARYAVAIGLAWYIIIVYYYYMLLLQSCSSIM